MKHALFKMENWFPSDTEPYSMTLHLTKINSYDLRKVNFGGQTEQLPSECTPEDKTSSK